MSTDQATEAPATQGPRRGVSRQSRVLPTFLALVRMPSASVLVATVGLTLLIGVMHPNFLQMGQMLDILQASSYVALMAIGMSFLIAMREIDLSVGSQFGLCVIVTAMLMEHGWNPWVAGVACLVLGGALGAINSALVAAVRIPAIVATLATLSVFRGLAIGITDGQPVTNVPLDHPFFTVLGGKLWGIPFSVIVLVVVAVPLGIVMHHTRFGYRVLAIGSNPDAARFAGISIPRVRTMVLILLGVLCGLGGILGLAFFGSGDPNIGTGFELQAIAAAVIGGTPLRGGNGTVLGAIFGAILLNVVASGLTYFDIQANWNQFATGLVILVAVGIDSLFRRGRGESVREGT